MRILVLGAGFGGLELCTKLSEDLGDDADVVLIDATEGFVFGFSKLDVMFGRTTEDHVFHRYADFVKTGVQFVHATIRTIDPLAKRVDTDAGPFDGDVLVIALGADLDPAATPGLLDGGHEFYTEAGAFATRDVLERFEGGRVVVGVCGTPFKCPPAPSETALLVDDLLRERGLRDASEVALVMPLPVPIPPSPAASEALLTAFAERGIEWHPGRLVDGLDASRQVVLLGDGTEMPYDLFLAIPKHVAPEVVRAAGMCVDGWIPVDPLTLETRYPDVYAVGDVTSVGTPKAGVFAEGQGRVVADALVARVRGDESDEYDGRGICYIEFGHDQVGYVEAFFRPGETPTGAFDRAVGGAGNAEGRVRREPHRALVRPFLDDRLSERMMKVNIVPHTHWDREWYAPFQTYRAQLVHVLDRLLDLLDGDPAYRRFLLDGQTSVVDDYLEVRPEAASRLRRLVDDGRLAVGPWMVLMDEFMVSGETIVRDLQLGVARTNELGGKVEVGYLPDMFGHVAQMPQLLRLAGIEHAVVWRGVPSSVDRTAFWWGAPDGSRVRAEYLYGSYSNGRDLPSDPALLVARARGYVAELGDAALPGGGVLLMNGSDHLPPQRHLGVLIDEANALQDEYEFRIVSLAEHVTTQPVDGLPEWRGELRSGARANVLMGVASNRVDVHQLAAAAERALERRAEPLSALFLPPDDFPHALFGIAWRDVVLNSAHDSSCACSHDEVVEAVRVRYQEARHVGEALAHDALIAHAKRVDAPPASTVVVNVTARARSGLVFLSVPGSGRPVHLRAVDDGSVHPAEALGVRAGRGLDTVVVGRKIGWVLEMMRGPELAGARIARVEHATRDDGVEEFVFHDAGPGDPELDLEPTRERLQALGDTGATIAIRQLRAPVLELAAHVADVPAFGWRTFEAVDGPLPEPPTAGRSRRSHARTAGGRRDFVTVERGRVLDNGLVRVEVDRNDGTLTIDADGVHVTGANRYVEGGDGGDTYNYSPPAVDTIIDTPDVVHIESSNLTGIRARLRVRAGYEWPIRAVGDEHSCRERSAETDYAEIRTTLELRTGEPFVRVRVDLDHRTRDHRLRAHVPLPVPVTTSHAECAFAVVERGLTAEGGPHEVGLPTFVSRRFVDCSAPGKGGDVMGVALLHDGLLEYEIVDGGRVLALTLLRATGYLSRAEPSLRPNPAGPLDRLEGPQLQRPLRLEYAILPHRGDWRAAGVADAADDLLVPLERVRGGGWPGADLPPRGQALDIEGARVSALTRDASGALVVRLVNLSPDPSTARVRRDGQPLRGAVVDLVGTELTPFTGTVELRPWEIVTLRLA